MKAYNSRESLTEREREEFEQEKTIAQLQAGYQVEYRRMELELKRVETKWTQVFRLPFALLMMPVRFMLAIGYLGHAIRGTQPSDKYWDYLTKL